MKCEVIVLIITMIFRKQDFKRVEPIGQGKKHTRIFKVVHIPTGQLYALKEIEAKTMDKLNEYKEEAVQLMKVQPHDNIIKFFGYYFHQTNYNSFRIGIITEFLENSTCLEAVYRKRKKAGLFWKESELAAMLMSIISSCAYLQQKGICHRDIKPANMFLKPNFEIKLIDFGESKDYVYDPDDIHMETYTQATIRGTPQYLSPVLWQAHVIDGTSRYADHNIYKSDVFSTGLVIFQMASMAEVSGFNQRTDRVNGEHLIREGLAHLSKRYSREFVSLIELTLVFEEKRRATFVQLEQIFAESEEGDDKENPYIKQYNRLFSNIYKAKKQSFGTHSHSQGSEMQPQLITSTVKHDPVSVKEKKKFLQSTLIQNDSCYWFEFGGNGIGKFTIAKRRWKLLTGEITFPMHFIVTYVPQSKTYYLLGGNQHNNFKSFKNGKLALNPDSQMHTNRNFFPVVHHSRKLFVMGGFQGLSKRQLRSCQYYDLERHLWVKMASLNTERSMSAAVKINNDEVLIMGGYNKDQGTLDTIESYSFTQDRWEQLRIRLPLPLRRFVAVRLAMNVCLIMGGLTRNSKESQRVFRLEYPRGEFVELQNLEKGGVIQSEVLTDGQGNLHLFLEIANGTSPHAHITYQFDQTQRRYETNNDL